MTHNQNHHGGNPNVGQAIRSYFWWKLVAEGVTAVFRVLWREICR